MSGIPTPGAASEYARRAVMLARIGRWPYLNLRFVDVLVFTGLRTNATKKAAPAFHAHVGRLVAAQVEANLSLFTRSPQTATLLAVTKELSDMAHNRKHEDNPLMRQPTLFDGATNG